MMIKMAKVRQNRHQSLFSVISFHAGVYLRENQLKLKIFSKSYKRL